MTTPVLGTGNATRRIGYPKINWKLASEILVHSGIAAFVGAISGKILDKNYPRPDKNKSMFQSLAETYVHIGLLGVLLYVLIECLSWAANNVYKVNMGIMTYVNVVLGVTLISVQPNLKQRLVDL